MAMLLILYFSQFHLKLAVIVDIIEGTGLGAKLLNITKKKFEYCQICYFWYL